MEKKNSFEVYISLLKILLSNAVVVYGVVYLSWNFFMVIYSYWFGELISSIVDKVRYTTLKNRDQLPKVDAKQADGRFFFLFLYWIFIVIIVGFIVAPSKTYGENILVIFFMNKFFNLNLLFVLLGELALYFNTFFVSKNYEASEIVVQNSMMNKRTLIMHISIIFGTFAWFATNTDKFFFHIDVGEYGPYGFMIVFIVIRVIGDMLGLYTATAKKS